MSAADVLTLVLSVAGSALAILFAGVVLRADRQGVMNRRLAALLVIDGVFFAFLASTTFYPLPALPDLLIVSILLLTSAAAHLLFAGTLETPLVRWLRGRASFQAAAVIGTLLFLIILVQVVTVPSPQDLDSDLLRLEFTWLLMGASSIFALVASFDAFRRTAKGTPAHRRARSFVMAFGARDSLFAIGIFGYGATEFVGSLAVQKWMPVVISSGVILFVSLLTYGILSTQLFDIDLRIKWGISRSTVVTIGIVAVLGVLKTAEYTFNRTLGAVAAGLTAGLVLVLAPRLNKLGDKVANAAMPAVQPTSDYVAYKKLEVYRAAVESALEGDRGIDKAERAMLDRLRTKLGLSEVDAKTLEAEIAGGG